MVRHDWGAVTAWYLGLFCPDRVKGLINLSVPSQPRVPQGSLRSLRATFGDDYYVIRFQEPGEMEATRSGVANVLKKFLTYHDPGPLIIPKDKGFETESPIALPAWLSEADIYYYTSKYEHKGFTGGLSYYRALDLTI